MNDFISQLEESILSAGYTGYEKFWDENFDLIVEYEEQILGKLKEYAPSKSEDYTGFFYRYLYFFQFKPKNKYYSEKIVSFLKHELRILRESNKPKFYSNIISALFSIEGKKVEIFFYQQEFSEIQKTGFNFSAIYSAFTKIFISLGEEKNEVLPEFSRVFCELIIFSVDEIISGTIEKGWEYISGLSKEDFNTEFFKILSFFDSDEKRKELEHHHKYTSLFTLDKYSEDRKRFTSLRNAIEKNFGDEEYEKFEKFIIAEVNYLLDIHEAAIHKNVFVSEGINILQKNNSDFIIRLIKQVSTEKTFWGLETTLSEYLEANHIEEIISFFRGTENEFTIFRIYSIIKDQEKKDLVNAFAKSSYGKEIQKILKERNKQEEKYKQEEIKRIQKQKDNFFQLITPLKDGGYYPKLFQDYVKYFVDKGSRQTSIFSEEEKKKIDASLLIQIQNYFSKVKLKDIYQNPDMLAGVTFEKTGENSYSSSWNGYFMTWFLQIAQIFPEVEKILQKNYKAVLLFFPLMFGNQVENYFFEKIIEKKLDEEDVTYFIRVYSEDLHENAKGLRFYHVQNFIVFFNTFQEKFQGFENQVEKICEEMLSEKKNVEIYYRERFLDIYAHVLGEKRYRKYWKSLEKQYPKFNYFDDILKNQGEKSAEELKEMRFFLTAQTILVERFAQKSDIIWRIEQLLQTEPIEATSRFDDDYPHYSGVRTWTGEGKFEEIEWLSFDREEFAYIFSLENVGKIDVSEQMLKILEKSLQIKSLGEKEKNLFANYLQKIVYKYFEVFDEKLATKELYFDILRKLEKFDYKYYYTFDFEFFREKLNIDKEIERIVKKYSKNENIVEEKILHNDDQLLIECEKNADTIKEDKIGSSEENTIDECAEKIAQIKKQYESEVEILKEKIRSKNGEIKEYQEEKSSILNDLKSLAFEKDKLFQEYTKDKKESDERINILQKEKDNIESYYQIQKTDVPDCIVYVEGPSDKIVLDYILDNEIFSREKKYKILIIDSNSCRGVSNNLRCIKSLEKNDIPVLGIYDFDNEGVTEFKDIICAYGKKDKINGMIFEEDYFNCRTKKYNKKKVFASLLPVPKNKISSQVLYKVIPDESENRQQNSGESNLSYKDFGTSSLLVLEHLFYAVKIGGDNYKKLERELYNKEPSIGPGNGKRIIIRKRAKVDFINKIISKDFSDKKELVQDENLFANFEPIIRMIDRIASLEFDKK